MSEHSESSRGSIVSVLALVVALVAVGLAVWALTKGPSSTSSASESEPASVFTGDTTDDPKASVCEAFNVVRNGVQFNTNMQPPGGPADVTGTWRWRRMRAWRSWTAASICLPVCSRIRLPDLADAVRKFGNQLMDIGARSIAGIPNADPDQAARLKDADATNAMITTLCK